MAKQPNDLPPPGLKPPPGSLPWPKKSTGKTLRDEFAMAALTGLAAKQKSEKWRFIDMAECAYRFADAMLEERSKK